jgi:hypothetical protein
MNQPSRVTLCFYALFALSVGGLLMTSILGRTYPARASLRAVTGQAVLMPAGRKTINFGLVGQTGVFSYASMGAGSENVKQALAASKALPVSILFDAGSAAASSSQVEYQVYEIAAGGKAVKSYEDIKEDSTFNDKIGVWCSVFFILFGCYSLFRAIRPQRRRNHLETITWS